MHKSCLAEPSSFLYCENQLFSQLLVRFVWGHQQEVETCAGLGQAAGFGIELGLASPVDRLTFCIWKGWMPDAPTSWVKPPSGTREEDVTNMRNRDRSSCEKLRKARQNQAISGSLDL